MGNPNCKPELNNENEFVNFLFGEKIKGIRKVMTIRISHHWNNIHEKITRYAQAKSNIKHLSAYEWIYNKNIKNI